MRATEPTIGSRHPGIAHQREGLGAKKLARNPQPRRSAPWVPDDTDGEPLGADA